MGAYNRPPHARKCASAKMSFPNIGLVAIELHEIVSRNCRHWHGLCIGGAARKDIVAGKPGSREAGKPGSREAGKPGSREAGKPGSREAGKPGTKEPRNQGTVVDISECSDMTIWGNIFPGCIFWDCHDIGYPISFNEPGTRRKQNAS
jgi:hypothetical protein